MRTHLAIALAAALGATLFASPVFSADTPQQANMKSCAANGRAWPRPTNPRQLIKPIMSTCMKAPASTAAAPATPAPAMAMTAKPAAAKAAPAAMKAESGTAKCKDGKTVSYTHRSGTCSGHGGVASWM